MSLRDKIEHAIQNQPCMVKDLKAKFGGDRAADRKVMEALDELVHDAVVCQKSGVFFTARSGRAEKALPCKVVKLGKNFAFVMLEDESGDIFIPGRFTRGAMPGDSVLVEKFAHPRVEGSDEGEILAVLEQKNDMVGTVRRIEGRLKFVPDDCPAISMTIQRDCEGGAKDGDKVAVGILAAVDGSTAEGLVGVLLVQPVILVQHAGSLGLQRGDGAEQVPHDLEMVVHLTAAAHDIADIVLVAVAGTAGQRVLLKHMDVVALHLAVTDQVAGGSQGRQTGADEVSRFIVNALRLFGVCKCFVVATGIIHTGNLL